MFRRNLMAVWIGILLLSSIYLMGQEPWGQPLPCDDAVVLMNSQACVDEAYANVDTLKTCLAGCGGPGACDDQCREDWNSSIPSCFPGVETLAGGYCGYCYVTCFDDFIEYSDGCMYNGGTTGAQCLDELLACINGC